jgi:F420-dependent oxidoreductase-like protein
VSEGWHGVRFDKPLARTREYVEVVRKALRRERLTYQGEHYQLPLPDGPGKALTLTVHPARENIPVYLAAVGPKNLELAGEIADGWLAIFFSPEYATEGLAQVAAGRARVGRTLDGFDVVPTVPVVLGDDPATAADAIRPYTALYVGGMGSREKNFYNAQMIRMGYPEQAAEIQDRYLARDYTGAMAAVPVAFLEQTALLGDRDRIADRLPAYAEAGVTTLTVACQAESLERSLATLRTVAEAAERAGVVE